MKTKKATRSVCDRLEASVLRVLPIDAFACTETDGTVTITGTVVTVEERHLAGIVGNRVPGIRKLVNKLKVNKHGV